MKYRFPFFLSMMIATTSVAQAENWTQWRGRNNDGISSEKGIAKSCSDANIVWKIPLPGPGGATPVVFGDRIYVTSAQGSDLVVLAISTKDGKTLWTKKVTSGNQPARGNEGNSASPSPVTDGQHVWVFYSTGILACLTVDGDIVWKQDVGEAFGALDIQFGLTSTPVLDGNDLYLQLIHGRMQRGNDSRTGLVIKLEAKTGKTIWKYDRVTKADFECKHSYASPFLYRDDKREFLTVHGADCTTGHDLKTGKELWRFGNLNGPTDWNPKQNDPTFRFVASPLITRSHVIVPTAKEGPLVSLNLDQLSGDCSNKKECVDWIFPRTPDVSIPLAVDDLLYLLQKDGRLQCVEWQTGKEIYLQRVHNSQHRSSPVYADGHIYIASSDGTVSIVKAGREFEIVSSTNLGAPINASPVISQGTLYLRSYESLFAIR